ncbi:MAG TPA: hypothetical protein VLY87_06155 [Flavobacterium sp.]|nr:hypothetical protein [Flavobacterium sp.]
MKNLIIAFAVFCSAFGLNAQNVVFKKVLERPKQLTYYAQNHLGDTSFIVSDEIAKETLLRTFTFKDPFLGTIHQYDERNPLQQLVFYKNTQQLVVLDNQLSVKERVALTERFPEIDASYAAFTAQSSIWIFDEVSKRWCVLNSLKEQPQFVSNPILSYDFITSDGNNAYWKNGTSVLGIDTYGKIIKEQSLPKRAKLLAINGSKMLYQLNNAVFLFDTEKATTEPLKEVKTLVEKAFFNAQNISILTSNQLFLYHLN